MKRVMLVALLCVAVPFARMHADEVQRDFTLPEIVDLALEKSQLILASQKSALAAKWGRRQSSAWQNPSISVGAGYKSQAAKNGYAYDASITQPFYFPGKQKLMWNVAGYQERLAGLDAEETALFVRYNVIRLSFQYAIANELAAHLEERVRRFRIIRTYLTSRPFPSPQKQMEKNLVEMKLVLLQKELAELQAQREIGRAQLGVYVDLPGEARITVPWYVKGEDLQWDLLLAATEKRNIDLRKQIALLERIGTETRLAKIAALPDFSLSFLYSEERAAEAERFIGGGVSFTIPVLDTNRNGVKSLKAAKESEQARYEYLRRETVQALRATFVEYEVARINLARLPMRLLDDVHKRLIDADAWFNKGLVDLVTYNEVESQGYEMHEAVFRAQLEYVDRYAALLVLQGSHDFAFTER